MMMNLKKKIVKMMKIMTSKIKEQKERNSKEENKNRAIKIK